MAMEVVVAVDEVEVAMVTEVAGGGWQVVGLGGPYLLTRTRSAMLSWRLATGWGRILGSHSASTKVTMRWRDTPSDSIRIAMGRGSEMPEV